MEFDKLNAADINIFNVEIQVKDPQQFDDNGALIQNHNADFDDSVGNALHNNANPRGKDGRHGKTKTGHQDEVTKSFGDLSYRKMPVRDMEIDILRGGSSSEYIVMDKMTDGRILRMKAKSQEIHITND